jgi:hypothetical protein
MTDDEQGTITPDLDRVRRLALKRQRDYERWLSQSGTPEYRERTKIIESKRTGTPKRLAFHRALYHERMLDPEYRERKRESTQKRRLDPAMREKEKERDRERARKLREDPVYRERAREYAREYARKRKLQMNESPEP